MINKDYTVTYGIIAAGFAVAIAVVVGLVGDEIVRAFDTPIEYHQCVYCAEDDSYALTYNTCNGVAEEIR